MTKKPKKISDIVDKMRDLHEKEDELMNKISDLHQEEDDMLAELEEGYGSLTSKDMENLIDNDFDDDLEDR